MLTQKLVEMECWNKNAIAILEENSMSCHILVQWELFSIFWISWTVKEILRRNINLILFGDIEWAIISLIVDGLIQPLTSINFLSIDMRDEEHLNLTIGCTHDLFLLLVLWLIFIPLTLHNFNSFKLSNIWIKCWHLYHWHQLFSHSLASPHDNLWWEIFLLIHIQKLFVSYFLLVGFWKRIHICGISIYTLWLFINGYHCVFTNGL